MDNKIPAVSYALAALSGICFVGGLVILSNEGRQDLWSGLQRYYQHSITR